MKIMSLNRKSGLVLFFFLFFTITLNAQEKAVIAVDGYFTNKDSAEVVALLGEGFIKELIKIPPDSAQILIGEFGRYGILNIITNAHLSEKSKYFRSKENSLYEGNPSYLINNKEVDKSEISLLNPSKIISVNTISQLESALRYGKEKRFGAVLVTVRD